MEGYVMDWEPADKVQKNEQGQYRAFIGGHWIPVQRAQKSDKGEFRVQRFTPTDVTSETPETPEKPSLTEKTKDFFTKRDPGHEFSMKNVYESMGAGAALGGVAGGFAGGVGAIPGAVTGAGVGLVGGLAGETARTIGASPAVAMATEAVGGGLASVGRQATAILAKGLMNLHAKSASKEAMKLAEEFGAPSVKADIVEQQVKAKALGKKPESIPVEQTVRTDLVQQSHYGDLARLGIPVKAGEKPTDALRNVIYGNMDTLVKSGKPFATSPEMGALGGDLQTLLNRNLISREQVGAIQKILKNQVSKDPKTAAKANEDILSLLQSGGVYSAREEMKKKIGEEAQFAIRQRVGQYYKNNLGKSPGFEELKTMERQDFQAKALDSIPNMVRENFKDTTSAAFKSNMENIANSGPDGKQAFVTALKTHFYDKSPSDFMKEFNRLRKPLQESGVMDAKALDQLRVVLERIPKDIPKERWKIMAIRAFQGTAYAEIARGAREITGNNQ